MNQTVIGLKTQDGITSQRIKWANSAKHRPPPRTSRGWDQAHNSNRYSLLTGHIHREPCFVHGCGVIPPPKSVCQDRPQYRYEKCQTTVGPMNVCYYKRDRCNNNRTYKTLTSNKTAYE
jgi:hypothetical protein